jgi:hypothetical protein
VSTPSCWCGWDHADPDFDPYPDYDPLDADDDDDDEGTEK